MYVVVYVSKEKQKYFANLHYHYQRPCQTLAKLDRTQKFSALTKQICLSGIGLISHMGSLSSAIGLCCTKTGFCLINVFHAEEMKCPGW